jgi:hypothetical protein
MSKVKIVRKNVLPLLLKDYNSKSSLPHLKRHFIIQYSTVVAYFALCGTHEVWSRIGIALWLLAAPGCSGFPQHLFRPLNCKYAPAILYLSISGDVLHVRHFFNPAKCLAHTPRIPIFQA